MEAQMNIISVNETRKKDIEQTKTLLDNCNEKTDEGRKIDKKCDTEEEEDLGFGLFD
jgi:hypothetical protein